MSASAILLAITGWDPNEWDSRLRAAAPARDVRCWPDRIGDKADVAYACTWKAPSRLLAEFPNLKVILSLGAGVDHILKDPALPAVPVVRIVDPDLTMRMTEYVALHVLMHHRRVRLYDPQQRRRLWRDHHQPAAKDGAGGGMGLRGLRRDAAPALARPRLPAGGLSRPAASPPRPPA